MRLPQKKTTGYAITGRKVFSPNRYGKRPIVRMFYQDGAWVEDWLGVFLVYQPSIGVRFRSLQWVFERGY